MWLLVPETECGEFVGGDAGRLLAGIGRKSMRGLCPSCEFPVGRWEEVLKAFAEVFFPLAVVPFCGACADPGTDSSC